MEVKDVLVAARKLVFDGWTQFALTNGHGDYCLRAAIGLSCGAYELIGNSVWSPRLDFSAATTDALRRYTRALITDTRAVQIVQQVLPAGHRSIPEFNDAPETSRQDVLDVLDAAILFEDSSYRVISA